MDSLTLIERISSQNKETLALFGIVISVLTLLLAFRIQKLFARNHIKAKQVDHVCNLIELLNNSEITVGFSTYNKDGGYASHGISILFNIFELGSYDKIESGGSNIKYNDERVLFDSKSNQILDVKKYVDHPLTPKKIADELLNFHNSYYFYIDNQDPNINLKEFVLIRTNIFNEKTVMNSTEKGSLIEGTAVAFLSWENLKAYSINLKLTIAQWLNENGISDNNIREDFKNTG